MQVLNKPFKVNLFNCLVIRNLSPPWLHSSNLLCSSQNSRAFSTNGKRMFSTTITNSAPNERLPSNIKKDIKSSVKEYYSEKVPKFKEPCSDELYKNTGDNFEDVTEKYIVFMKKHCDDIKDLAENEKNKCNETVSQEISNKYPEFKDIIEVRVTAKPW